MIPSVSNPVDIMPGFLAANQGGLEKKETVEEIKAPPGFQMIQKEPSTALVMQTKETQTMRPYTTSHWVRYTYLRHSIDLAGIPRSSPYLIYPVFMATIKNPANMNWDDSEFTFYTMLFSVCLYIGILGSTPCLVLLKQVSPIATFFYAKLLAGCALLLFISGNEWVMVASKLLEGLVYGIISSLANSLTSDCILQKDKSTV